MTTKNKQISKQAQHSKELKRITTKKRLLLLALAVVLTFIIIPKGGFFPAYYVPGDIASRDIKTPHAVLVPEPELTAKKKQHAEQAVLPVYDYDTRPSNAVANALTQTVTLLSEEELRAQQRSAALKLVKTSEDDGAGDVVNSGDSVEQPLPPVDVPALLGIELTDDQLAVFHHLVQDAALAKRFKQSIHVALHRKVVGNLDLFKANWHGAISVRDLATQQEFSVKDVGDVIGLNEVVTLLSKELFGKTKLTQDEQTLLSVVQKMIRPNLTFNQSETEARRRAAAEAVLPVLLQVKSGEMIVREGERVTAEQIRKLAALQSSVDSVKILRSALGLLLIILISFYTIHRFAKESIRKYNPLLRDLLFLTLVFVSFFIVAKVGIFVAVALQSAFPYVDSVCYYYSLPFAAAVMLVRIVINSEVAYVFAILFALLIGLLFGNNLFITIYALVGSVTAAHWVRHSKARSNLYLAGWYLSLVNMVMVLGIFLVSNNALDIQLLYSLGFAFLGGFGCAVIVNGTIPLMESLFKYTTDFKLLELANMNTPVLRELMIQAPGTYHHSIIVGNLVENAAESIGANPLLARVAAYYHDIGKIKKPLYFAENMRLPENRHDKLAPSMSALILISHVKDGVELAREHKLGQNIVDIIHQHHGTSLIKFFYDKAQQRDKEAQVKEQDYRYPGPKPQTREAALIMLADAVEAASRTLSEPTSARIQGMVQKLINKIFIDGQLDECELTLKDLHEIAKSFNRILSGIFHNRIDYPEPAYKEREKDIPKDNRGDNKAEGKTTTCSAAHETAKKISKKDMHGEGNGKKTAKSAVEHEVENGDNIPRESTKDLRNHAGRPEDSGAEDLKRLGMS